MDRPKRHLGRVSSTATGQFDEGKASYPRLERARPVSSLDRQPMTDSEYDIYGVFRKIGSKGLVIFERDGTLLRRKSPPGYFTLGDISNQFVEMLRELRERNVRFGFISDQRGMDDRSRGGSEFAALTRLLDQLMGIRDAAPDFWISRDAIERESEKESRDQDEWRRDVYAAPILRAIEWYGVDKNETVLVNSTAVGLLAANHTGVTGVQYFGLKGSRAMSPRVGEKRQDPSSSETLEIEWLCFRIQQILGVNNS